MDTVKLPLYNTCMQKTAVIGAGPAGLLAAIGAANHGEVTLFEKMGSPGRKLLISGSGQCNITHTGTPAEFTGHYGTAGRFLRNALYEFTPESLTAFFQKLGIAFVTEKNGKIFPRSRKARDVLNALTNCAETRGVKILTSRNISGIERTEKGMILHINEKTTGPYSRVVLTCGGKSYPTTGSDGSGYLLAASLGHTIIPPRPALTDARIQNFSLSAQAGASFTDIIITHIPQAGSPVQMQGDLLISHTGFSGPVILDASRNIMPGDKLMPDFSGLGEKAETTIRDFCSSNGSRQVSSLLPLFVCTSALFNKLLKHAGIPAELKLAEVSKNIRRQLVTSLKETAYTVSRMGDFSKAMATAGGVNRAEINPKTMESRIVPGLFFAGEIMDIDGDTGGYNLQAAFSTGSLAGKNCRD